MDKALRALIIVLLVLSIGALILEFLVFGQREELKGRNLLLMRDTIELAKTIEVPPGTNVDLVARDQQHVALTENDLKHFYQVDGAGKPVKDAATGKKLTTGPGTMDATLKDLRGKAELQFSRLNDTRIGLEQTRTDLASTSNTLKQTEDTLTAARKDIKDKTDTIATQKADIEKKAESITTLEGEKEKLTAKNEQQTTKIAELTDKVSDRDSQLEATKVYVKRLETQIKRYEIGKAGDETNALPPGLYGQILAVNPNWNFVVIDILPDSALMPMIDLVIQRDSKLIGKVHITEVFRDHNFAVGEVLPDWRQAPVDKGDYVFY
jgi:hypothetical protein